jgi:hypothetical protein
MHGGFVTFDDPLSSSISRIRLITGWVSWPIWITLAASVLREMSLPKRRSSAAIRYSGSPSMNLARMIQASVASVDTLRAMMRRGAGTWLAPIPSQPRFLAGPRLSCALI